MRNPRTARESGLFTVEMMTVLSSVLLEQDPSRNNLKPQLIGTQTIRLADLRHVLLAGVF